MIKKSLAISIALALGTQTVSSETTKAILESHEPDIQLVSNAGQNQLILSVGVFDPLYEELSFAKQKLVTKKSAKYSIVQFHPGKTDSQWLKSRGAQIMGYLPNNAFIVANQPDVIKQIQSHENVRWVGSYLSNYKVSPSLWEDNFKQIDESTDLFISFFNNYPKKNLGKLLRKVLPNAKLVETYNSEHNDLIIRVPSNEVTGAVQSLSQVDVVQYIDRSYSWQLENTEAVSAVQANSDPGGLPIDDSYRPSTTPIWDKGLIGSGQIVTVADSGLDSNEDWFVHLDNGTTVTHEVTPAETVAPPTVGNLFPNRKVVAHYVMPGAEPYDHADASYHGTHVSGSVAGDRLETILEASASISSPTTSGYDNDDGMAPNAQLIMQDWGSSDDGGGGAFSMDGLFTQAFNSGSNIHTNSWSTGDAMGAYTFIAVETDRAIRKKEDMLILFAAGNDDGNFNSISAPGTAKNVLTVGALAHGNSPFVARFSNRGPTDDDRIKPDIMATGANIESAGGNEENSSTISPPARATLGGTSMATPITAGSAALVRQYFTDGFYPTGTANSADKHIPTGPLLKATLINGAGIDGGHFDKDIGWGRVFLSNSIMFDDSDKQMRAWEFINESGLKTGETMDFTLQVKSGQPLAVTLAWYDLEGPFGSTKTLINDLDLSVSVNGQTYKGNVWSDIAISGTGGEFDDKNTVEQVRIPAPVDGTYTITVRGSNVPGNGSLNSFRQGFGLVATGDFDNLNGDPGSLGTVSGLSSQSLGDNGTEISWQGGDNADFFEVYRVEGTCASADFSHARFVGTSDKNLFVDYRTLTGNTYAYKVRASQFKGLGPLSESCTEITSQQACDFLPTFDESQISIIDNVGDICHNQLQWSAASSNCPSASSIKYNIYRSEDRNFLPSDENLIATTSSTSFDDIRAPDTPAYYIVRAMDDLESTGTRRIRSQAVGTGSTFSAVTDDVDNVASLNLNFPWQVSSERAFLSELSYKTGQDNGNYPADTCSSMVTNTISLTNGDPNPVLSYVTNYDLEENWDGVVVEISTDGGSSWNDFPPVGGYPGDFSETTANPVNACGYPASQKAFSGSSDDSWDTYSHDLSPYVGQDVLVRWRLSTDPASEFPGFFIDNIELPNLELPSACTVNTAPEKPQAGFWYDPAHNGHGFVVEPFIDDIYFSVFYTYKDDGTPEWYTSISTLENNILNIDMDDNTLLRVIRDFDTNTSNIDTSVGTNKLRINFNSAQIESSNSCNDGADRGEVLGLAEWQLGDVSGAWCIRPLINESRYPDPDLGAIWWAGESEDGWGFSITFSDDVIVSTLYYFDADGNPRWAIGQSEGFVVGAPITFNLLETQGYPRTGVPNDLNSSIAGTITLTLNSVNQGLESDGTVTVDVNYQGTEGGSWSRTDLPLTNFTQSH